MAARWTSSSAIAAITESLNRAYDMQEGRPFWKARGIAILLTIGLSLFIIVSIILLSFGSQMGGCIAPQVQLGWAFQATWKILRWPAIVFLMIWAMAMLHYFAPAVEQEA